ncbi:MAG TPA: UDP-N-acetylmuramoyl-L-alanine--D-glutamate ligase [Candidatus Acidoferrum sp.]|nr:UDP-N-acetylmuramoyl-L-alanine--D-glutamate ligase [Candidatus Acidoferrum sp.]
MMTFDARETILVIGLGKSGLACARVLRSRGATVFATDEKAPHELSEAIATIEQLGARFVAPDALESIVANLTSAVLSPGVPLNSPMVLAVQNRNVPVLGEIEVAFRLCKAPIVAVSGTKGKSTTTALIGHLLQSCGRNVRVGGNIGNPLIDEVVDARPTDWVVAEVSSFQLETIRAFKPRVAVLLNVAPDHLDRYHSMDEYAEAKFRIAANQGFDDLFIGNLDDERIASLDVSKSERAIRSRQLWFTLGDRHDNATIYVHGDDIVYAPISGDPRPVKVMRKDEIPLAGAHNVQNVMAALLAAYAVGCETAALREGVMSFTAMPHRLQPVDEIDGVLYVDDSKSTNPGSVVAALQSYDRPIVLIAGGRAKGTDFIEMGVATRQRAKALVVIGEAAGAIADAAKGVETVRAASMIDAVQKARAFAARGDVVLLSPGCASFDMFRSAEDRGEQFAAAVHGLRLPAGA